MPRTHQPIQIDEFKGLFSRSDYQVPPIGYLAQCDDCVFCDPGTIQGTSESPRGTIFSRPIHTAGLALPSNVGVDGGPVRFHKYRQITDTQDQWIILSAAKKFYDTGSGTPNTPILDLSASTAPDFSLITIGQRCIFSPHDRDKGVVGEFTYIYERGVTATARKLCGAKPAGVFTVAVSATNGNTEPGLHILAVAYEFNTGFVTKPALYQQLTAPAGVRKAIDLTAIPLGGAGVVARRILMSRLVKNFDGNNENPELFFALKINDNVTVALANAINMYDTQLIQSADYLKDNLEEVPAMLCFAYHEKSLVCAGAGIEKSVVRVSKANDYETFAATDGFVQCAPFEGDGVRNLKSARGTLYMFKRKRSFSTRNNGKSASSWPVDLVDSGLGAEVFSVSEVDDSIIGSINNTFIIGNVNGLWYFDNGFVDLLSWPVAKEWNKNTDFTSINKLEVIYMSMFGCAWVFVGPNSGSGRVAGNRIFFVDLRGGIQKESAKWSKWNLMSSGAFGAFAGMHVANGADGWSRFIFLRNAFNNLHEVKLTDIVYAVAPDSEWVPIFTIRVESPDGGVYNWPGVRFLFSKDPQFNNSTAINFQGGQAYDLPGVVQYTIPSTRTKGFYFAKVGQNGQFMDFSIIAVAGPSYFAVMRAIIYTKPIGEDTPS